MQEYWHVKNNFVFCVVLELLNKSITKKPPTSISTQCSARKTDIKYKELGFNGSTKVIQQAIDLFLKQRKVTRVIQQRRRLCEGKVHLHNQCRSSHSVERRKRGKMVLLKQICIKGPARRSSSKWVEEVERSPNSSLCLRHFYFLFRSGHRLFPNHFPQ